MTLYVEMKNKHNTMNSSSRYKIYSKMLETIKTSNNEINMKPHQMLNLWKSQIFLDGILWIIT
ncbi:Eco47II family restriction endonuclease [Mycoplasma sp. 2248]|uniref:Eco47II family restriction endonuclease n=1 Tax=Mycoplasma sp. 2248 TaxID=3108528 RepID=UPI003A4C6A1B